MSTNKPPKKLALNSISLVKLLLKNDFHNIDVDGDGFACDWDPAIYRKIKFNSETNPQSN